MKPCRRRAWVSWRLTAASLLLVFNGLPNRPAIAQDQLSGLPLDYFQFKASHNSYQRDEDIDDQIDNYNVWCVELDLNWETDCGPCITVDHCCDLVTDCAGEQRLDESIAEILRSTDTDQRVTFIWLDIKDPSIWWNRCHETWPANRREVIRNGMLGLGSSTIYSKTEFDMDFKANGGHWPSWQNLRDRGKRFILVLEDALDASGKDDDPILFIAVGSLDDARRISHATFINIEGADTTLGIPAPNDRWIYRAWGADWNKGVARGFNLIGTDDVDHGNTITDSRTHSPQPLYVNGFNFNSDRLWGTKSFPMNQIPPALVRATPGSTLRIRSGTYAGPHTFDKPLLVEKDPRYEGPVIIGGP